MLIVLEGPDGAGKSTMARAVAKRYSLDLIEFPNRGTLTGKVITQQLRDGITDPVAFQALQVVNRLEVFDRLAEAAGHWTKHLICVRYWQSGWVYGQLDGLPVAWLLDIQSSLPPADLNILAVPPDSDSAETRIVRRGEPLEDYETRGIGGELKSLYRRLWQAQDGSPFWTRVEDIHDVWRAIGRRFPVFP